MRREIRAVSSDVGSLDLHLVTEFSGTHSLNHRGFHAGDVISVEVVSIDAFLEERGWPQIYLIKIDVEGSEVDVLTGMRRLLEHQKSLNVIIELCPAELVNAGRDPSELIHILVQSGFEVQHISDEDRLLPFKQDQIQATIDSLTTTGASINLFCNR